MRKLNKSRAFLLNLIFFFLVFILSGCSPELTFNEFPGAEYTKVMAYKMKGHEDQVIENNKLSSDVLGKGIELTSDQAKRLVDIFYDSSTYGGIPAKCFNPRFGYVFYDSQDEIVGHSSICFACNWMKTHPDLGQSIFSKTGSERLGKIEKEIFLTE